MKTVKNLIIIIALLFSFPSSAIMADVSTQGKVIINVYDENSKPYVGNWYLYQGINDKGMTLRNGSSGETFTFQAGTYFLNVYKKDTIRPYHVIYSNNPQTLKANETITYNVQYFKTAEEMANASAPTVTEPAPVETVTTTPPIVSETTESVDTAATDSDTGASDSSESPTLSRTYMGPRVTLADLPNTSVSPATDSGSSSGGSENLPLQLAQTGSPALLILIFSGLLGSIAVRRKKV